MTGCWWTATHIPDTPLLQAASDRLWVDDWLDASPVLLPLVQLMEHAASQQLQDTSGLVGATAAARSPILLPALA